MCNLTHPCSLRHGRKSSRSNFVVCRGSLSERQTEMGNGMGVLEVPQREREREMVDHHHPWWRCEHLRCQRVSSSAENLSPRWCSCHVNGIAAGLSGGTVSGRSGGEEGGRRAAAAAAEDDASFFSISIPRRGPCNSLEVSPLLLLHHASNFPRRQNRCGHLRISEPHFRG